MTQNKSDYERSFENSGHKSTGTYIDIYNYPNTQGKKKNRARKIFWFNPPYIFFKLLKKDFPLQHSEQNFQYKLYYIKL